MRYALISPTRRFITRSPRLVVSAFRKLSTIHNGRPFEEEKSRGYNADNFYPASIGETVGGRYQLVSKLGFGNSSTVWLARATTWLPWQDERFVALKITNNTPHAQAAARRELDISARIFSNPSTHAGRSYIREILDSVEVQGPNGIHICLAMEPLRQPLWMLGQSEGSNGVVHPRTIKKVLPSIIKSLDYLHSEAQVVHTDLKGDHFLLPFEDSQVLPEYAARQEANPAPFAQRNGRPVYESRNSFGRLRGDVNHVKLGDFGLAVQGGQKHSGDIQPREYTAPEVMLKAGWTYSADIWNLGLVLWELLGDVNLISGRVPGHCSFSNNTRFAQMIRLLGPPPAELLSQADRTMLSKYFDEQGKFRYPELIPDESFSFSSKTPMLQGQDKELFVNFAKRMLTWRPEERATAKELLSDPWLKHAEQNPAAEFGYCEDTRLG